MKRLNVPGVAVGVYSAGREFGAGFGVTSVRNPLPVNEQTLFQIGSNTKTFVATAAMRLVESGALDLDAPVLTYLPDFRMRDADVTARVTMRLLMTHTGGGKAIIFSTRATATMRSGAMWPRWRNCRSSRRSARNGRTTTRRSCWRAT